MRLPRSVSLKIKEAVAKAKAARGEDIGAPPIVRNASDQYADMFADGLRQRGAITANRTDGTEVLAPTPSEVTELAEYLRLSGEQPPTTVAQDQARIAAERLNAGRLYHDEMLMDPNLPGIDHRVLQEEVNLPMDDASRRARAEEQGYVYGIDRDLWRGVPTRLNSREYPLNYRMDTNLEIPMWATDDIRRAREYTDLPRGQAYIPELRDYSNQDWIPELDSTRYMLATDDPMKFARGGNVRVVAMDTPFEYRGEGESFNSLHRDRMRYNSLPATEVGWRGDEIGSTDHYVQRANHEQMKWGDERTGVVFRNIQDPGPNRGEPWPGLADTLAIPYERSRARDMAMFHPLLRGRRGMLFGVGGAAALPYGLEPPQE